MSCRIKYYNPFLKHIIVAHHVSRMPRSDVYYACASPYSLVQACRNRPNSFREVNCQMLLLLWLLMSLSCAGNTINAAVSAVDVKWRCLASCVAPVGGRRDADGGDGRHVAS